VGEAEEAATAPSRDSKPAAQTRFVLEAMDELKAAMFARFDDVDSKFGTLQQVQTRLEEMDLKLVKHAETMEQMQVKVNLSMEALGKVQAEQNRVSSSLKGAVVTPLTIPERDS
jgi:uncharacterized coiled-coil protein SlyX